MVNEKVKEPIGLSTLVAALIKRQKREAAATTKKRERASTRSIPALFPEKQRSQRITAQEALQSQKVLPPMPARATVLSKQDAHRMLQEAKALHEIAMNLNPQHASTTTRGVHQPDPAEDLIRHASPR